MNLQSFVNALDSLDKSDGANVVSTGASGNRQLH